VVHYGPTAAPGRRRELLRPSRAALLLNGGGITGAAYEVGCLAALDHVLGDSFSTRAFDVYVGISAGAILAALLANGVAPGRLRHDIINERDVPYNFSRANIYRIDYSGLISACWDTLKRLTSVFRSYRREGIDLSLFDLLDVLQELLPSGFFSLEPLQQYLEEIFAKEFLTDRFEQLQRELYIPAIELDRGQRVVFGSAAAPRVAISQAIAASCAIPAFFQPYRIGQHAFIDGAMGGHGHLDVAIERGATLLVVVNPLVPIDCEPEHAALPSLATGRPASVAELGISFVGDQSLRIVSHERLSIAIEMCRRDHPEVDILLLEPSRNEPLLFLNGPMSFPARARILEHGFETTAADLETNRAAIEALLERHGLRGEPEACEQPADVRAIGQPSADHGADDDKSAASSATASPSSIPRGVATIA
jgi:NTE family protein